LRRLPLSGDARSVNSGKSCEGSGLRRVLARYTPQQDKLRLIVARTESDKKFIYAKQVFFENHASTMQQTVLAKTHVEELSDFPPSSIIVFNQSDARQYHDSDISEAGALARSRISGDGYLYARKFSFICHCAAVQAEVSLYPYDRNLYTCSSVTSVK